MHALGVGLVGRSHSPLSLATLQAHSILSDISRRSEADSFVGGAADADGTGAPGDGNGSFTAMTPGQHSVASTAPHSARHVAYARARLSTPVNTTERSGVSTPSFASPPHTVDVQRTVPWLKRLRGTPGSDVSGGTPGSAASGSGALAAAAANLDSFASPPPRKAARKAYSSGGGTAAGATAAASPSSPGTAGAGAGVGAGATAAASFSSVASSPKFSSPPTSSTPIPARALLPTTPISNRLAAPRTAAFATTGSWRCNVLRQPYRIRLDMCCGCVGVWVWVSDKECLLEELEDADDEPVPEFSLQLFPPVFRVRLLRISSRRPCCDLTLPCCGPPTDRQRCRATVSGVQPVPGGR